MIPRPTHLLGPVDATHRVLVTDIAGGQGHAACQAPGCGWVRVDILPWLSYEHGLSHVGQHLTDAQRARWSPRRKHGHEPATSEYVA